MNRKEKLIIEQILDGEKYFYKSISVDNVIIGYHNRNIKILLLRPPGFTKWILPGGYVLKTETLEDAATRIVRYRTGLKEIYMSQFYVFSGPERNKEKFFTPDIIRSITNHNMTENDDHWLLDDFITVGYFALTDYNMVNPKGDFYAEECQWWGIDELPELGFDHEDIIWKALTALKHFTYRQPIGKELLEEKFTIPELQSLYETILNKKIDSRNFLKKMNKLQLLEKLEEKKNIGGHRAPFLYKFDLKKYEELKNNNDGIIF